MNTSIESNNKINTNSKFADKIYNNGYIYTVDSQKYIAEALAIKGNKFLFVGPNREVEKFIGPLTEIVDLNGRMVLPAFFESHTHANGMTRLLYELNLQDALTTDDMISELVAYADKNPDLECVFGGSWYPSVFTEEGKEPTKGMIDQVLPDRPVVLYDYSHHLVWCNSLALSLSNITDATPNPPGGEIVRNPDTGEATGFLKETAIKLAFAIIQPYSEEQNTAAIKAYDKMLNKHGYNNSFIPYLYKEEIPLYAKLADAGELSMRYRAVVRTDPSNINSEGIDEMVQDCLDLKAKHTHPHFQMLGFKIFVDGVIEGGTGFLLKPYLPAAGYTEDYYGLPIWKERDLNELCAAADKAGLLLHAHAIGDAAVRRTLNAYEYAKTQNKTVDSRYGIVHNFLVHPDDLPRFGRLGIVASMQPYWAYKDAFYNQLISHIGLERANAHHPIRSLIKNGAVVTSSSDFPIVNNPNPFEAIQIGVTRISVAPNSASDGPFNPDDGDERVTVEEMIESFTINAAYSYFMEKEIGSIEVGKLADFIVLDQNLLFVPTEEVHTTKVLLNVFEGEEIYCDDSLKKETGIILNISGQDFKNINGTKVRKSVNFES